MPLIAVPFVGECEYGCVMYDCVNDWVNITSTRKHFGQSGSMVKCNKITLYERFCILSKQKKICICSSIFCDTYSCKFNNMLLTTVKLGVIYICHLKIEAWLGSQKLCLSFNPVNMNTVLHVYALCTNMQNYEQHLTINKPDIWENLQNVKNTKILNVRKRKRWSLLK